MRKLRCTPQRWSTTANIHDEKGSNIQASNMPERGHPCKTPLATKNSKVLAESADQAELTQHVLSKMLTRPAGSFIKATMTQGAW